MSARDVVDGATTAAALIAAASQAATALVGAKEASRLLSDEAVARARLAADIAKDLKFGSRE